MATKLEVYNSALRKVKQGALASLTEDLPIRYTIDAEYPKVIQFILERGLWKFAMRSVSITEDTDTDGAFGYAYAHNTPDDFVRQYAVSASDTLYPPLEDYIHESNIFWADVTPIYVRYVSNDSGYGNDLTQWPQLFEEAVATELAARIVPLASGSDSKEGDLEKKAAIALRRARTFEAMKEPPQYAPMGSWRRTRFAGRVSNSRYDRA